MLLRFLIKRRSFNDISHIKGVQFKRNNSKDYDQRVLTFFNGDPMKQIILKEFTLSVNTSPFQQYTQTGDVLRGEYSKGLPMYHGLPCTLLSVDAKLPLQHPAEM